MLSVHILIHFKVMLVTHNEMDMKNNTLRYDAASHNLICKTKMTLISFVHYKSGILMLWVCKE